MKNYITQNYLYSYLKDLESFYLILNFSASRIVNLEKTKFFCKKAIYIGYLLTRDYAKETKNEYL